MIGILLLGLLLIGAAIALAVRAVAMPRLSAAERLGQIDAYGFEAGKDQAGTERAPRFAIKVLAERIAPGHTWTARAPEPVPAEVAPTPESVAHARNTGAGPA